MKSIKNITSKALLVILDGFGLTENDHKNAIKAANTPHLDSYFKDYPFTRIEAGGQKVGLPKGVVGNSEVGHMNLGAGRPVRQDLVRINESIEEGNFSNTPLLKELIHKASTGSKRIHIMGLLSDGGVHSHIDHIKEVFKAISKEAELKIFFHAFMDGRDTARDSGLKYVAEILDEKNFHFASMQGRSIGMDRDRRWEKIESCYKTITGRGEINSSKPLSYLKSQYEKEIYDEFIEPVLFDSEFAIREEDCCFMINFRPDRAIELTLALTDPSFNEFPREVIPSYYLCMTPYVPDEVELPILFNKERVPGGISEYLSSLGHSQFKIAETEKYAHITFFFNGGEKKPFPKEEQFLVPSPKEVSTYDQKPEMAAPEVLKQLKAELQKGEHTFYLVNFANSDMVGHTGNFEAAVKAIETLDHCVEELVKTCAKENILMFITADHGNSDQMVYPDGTPHTSHTGSLVPFCAIHPLLKNESFEAAPSGEAALMDVSPTILYALGIEFPPLFEGSSIFK
jgi:2,3-bisphosphoglycerate-independent phosphoglycerate mutase